MIGQEEQLDILLNFKSNLAEAVNKSKSIITDLNGQIATLQSRWGEISKQRSKAANQERKEINDTIATLRKQISAENELMNTRNQYSAVQMKNHRVTMDSMIADRQKESKNWSNILKARFAEEDKYNKETEKLRAFSNSLQKEHLAAELISHKQAYNARLLEEKKFNEESRAFAKWGAEFNKQQLADELAMYKNNQRVKATMAKEAAKKAASDKKAEDRTWKGAWFGSDSGTTFGHKFLTTSQYAAAGAGIFAVASAFTALGTAALEADLNMRTMAAVLKLNLSDATALDKAVRNLGETYGGTTSEIEQVAIALGRAGIKTKDITDATEVVLAMARLTGDTFEQSSNAIISFQQVFGNTTSIQALGDKLAYVANVSRLTTHDIGTFSNYALAAAKDVGLTEDAVGGLAAAFSNAGVNASTIGTQIRRFTTLLTDNSEAVTNFFRSLGVNQDNLLANLQKGGKESNAAILEFVDTLKKVDKATFTNLTGQMDILAANSLQLMRNNSDNIRTFVTDLQTGMVGQLDSTKVILDSYTVTFETMWNKMKNIAANGLADMNEEATRLAGIWNLVAGEKEKASLNFLAVEEQNDAKALAIHRENFNKKLITEEKYAEYEQHFAAKSVERDRKVTELMSKNALTVVRTNQEKVASFETLRAAQLDVLLNENSTKNQIDIANKQYKHYTKQIEELTEAKQKEIVTSKVMASALSPKEALATVNLLLDANKNASKEEEIFRQKTAEAMKDNVSLMVKQTEGLSKYGNSYKELQNYITNDPIDTQAALNRRFDESVKKQREALSAGLSTEAYDAELNVIKDIMSINSKNIELKKEEVSLDVKKASMAKQSAQDTSTAENKRQKALEIQQSITTEAAKHAQYEQDYADNMLDSYTRAEQKYRLQVSTTALAYDNYLTAKGTTFEAEKYNTYMLELTKLYSTQDKYLREIETKEEKRKSFNMEIQSAMQMATEQEQVRLGIIEKATDSESEKLRLKIEQARLDGLINDTEKNRLLDQLGQLDTLQNRKKDIHTLSMEYQRQINEQETLGYTVAKSAMTELENGMMEFFDVTSEGWLDWHSLASSVLKDIYKQLLQQLVIKQLVSGIAGGITSAFGNVSTAMTYGTNIGSEQTAMLAAQDMGFATGGIIPAKGYATGGVLSGGTGIRDDIYLGNVQGTQMFAMGGEFITQKSSVNADTRGTLEYINKTGAVPTQGTAVNVPVKVNIENHTGQTMSADMIETLTKPNEKGEYEKVVNIVLRASKEDPRIRAMLKGR